MARAVEIIDVSKRFKLHRARLSTLKERVVLFRQARAHDEFWALKDVSLEVDHGETFGIVGANGSGKSTLLRLIAGILKPTAGEIRTYGRVAALLELGAGFHPDLSGRENVFLNGSILGLSRKEIERQFDAIVAFSELEEFIETPVRNYSSGMYVRLGFAVAVHMDPDILLVDEVLAVGDESFQDKCLQRIRHFQNEGRTIILVTHGVDLVRQMCERAVWLNHGEVGMYGDPTEVVRTYRDRVATTPTGERVSVTGSLDIKDVRLLDKTGEPAELFMSGEPMTVEVDLVAMEFVSDPVFHVNIHDSAGQHVFGTNTDWRYLKVDLDEGPAKLRIQFPALSMTEGRFTITLGAHSRDGLTIYATTDRSTRFHVRSESGEPGLLFMPCKFEVEGASVLPGER